MAHTDAHQPFKTTEYGRLFVEWRAAIKQAGSPYEYDLVKMEYGQKFARLGFPRKQFRRAKAVNQEARRINRTVRHTAKAAIRAGKYDELSRSYSPRHTAIWNCE